MSENRRLSRLVIRALSILCAASLAQAQADPGAPPDPDADTSPPNTAARTVADLVATYGDLRVDPAPLAVDGVKMAHGHLALVLGAGRAARVRAGEEPIGLFFKGKGGLEYLSTDPIEHPVLRFNAQRSTGLKPERAGEAFKIRADFEELLILVPGGPQVELRGEPAESLDEEFRKHRERFLNDRRALASHQLALWKSNAPGSTLVRAEFSGGGEDLVYILDAAHRRSETLYALFRDSRGDPEVRDWLWPTVLSDLPVGRSRKEPALPHFVLMDVDYTLVASDGREASLSVKESILPVSDGQRVLAFELLNTTFDVIGAGKLEPRRFRLKSAADASGRALPFHHADDELLVDLGAAPPANQLLELRFEIDGDVLIRPNRDNYWQLGAEPWFPQPDISGQAYTVHSTIKVRKPFVPLAPGRTIARAEEEEYNVVENRLDEHVEFTVAMAGKYEWSEQTRGGVTVRIASYAGRNEKAWEKLGNLTFAAMDYYEGFLGPFPCVEFNIIEINEYGYGQAPPCTMFITREAFQPALGTLNQIFSKGINERFAHEIAHQYWVHVVKVPGSEEGWLSESFAEYCAGLFIKKLLGDEEFKSLVTTWKSSALEANAFAPIPLSDRIRIKDDPVMSRYRRAQLLYGKGPYLLHRLHAEIGDRSFLTFLKSYQKTFRWKFGATMHVPAVLQAITGKDYAEYLDANFWGTGMPE